MNSEGSSLSTPLGKLSARETEDAGNYFTSLGEYILQYSETDITTDKFLSVLERLVKNDKTRRRKRRK